MTGIAVKTIMKETAEGSSAEKVMNVIKSIRM
jgi:hypothetical protein